MSSAGTRPSPVDQSRLDRIAFDVANNLFEFIPISNPVVVGFELPKRLTRTAKNLIRTFRTKSFDRACYPGEWTVGWIKI